MSSRTKPQVYAALRELDAEGFIDWEPDRHSDLKIIREWEDSPKDESASAQLMLDYEMYPGKTINRGGRFH